MTGDGEKFGTKAAIGAFVLVGTLLVLGTVTLFGKFHFFTPTLRAAIVFQGSISGLSVGSPVTFHGVNMGAVESIAIQYDAQTGIAYIPVIVRLDASKVVVNDERGKHPALKFDGIPSGLRAELIMQSFVTGQSEIDLNFDLASVAVLHPGVTSLPEIPTEQSTMQRVTEQLSKLPLRELTDNAAATLQSLRALSEKLNVSLPPLIDSLKTTSNRSAEVIGNAGQSITELQGRLDGTLAEISRLAAGGTQLLTQNSGELRSVLISANQTVVEARGLLADLKPILSERGSDRANIDSALRDLATSASSLRGLAGEVERNPQLLLTGRRP